MGRMRKGNIRRRWRMERASVTGKRSHRSRSNKFSGGDTTRKPPKGVRRNVWVGGYKKRGGLKVRGYFRSNRYYKK